MGRNAKLLARAKAVANGAGTPAVKKRHLKNKKASGSKADEGETLTRAKEGNSVKLVTLSAAEAATPANAAAAAAAVVDADSADDRPTSSTGGVLTGTAPATSSSNPQHYNSNNDSNNNNNSNNISNSAKSGKNDKKLYGAGDIILLVGEGDFSFANALLQRYGKSIYLVATSLDTAGQARKKYPDASSNMRDLHAAGMKVICGVDCQELHRRTEFRQSFTKIVFNFPHLGGDGNNVMQHQQLLRKFMCSAAQCLVADEDSEVHITLKDSEPYRSWSVPTIAQQALAPTRQFPALQFSKIVDFKAERWPGYVHRRTKGDAYAEARGLDHGNVLDGAKTTIFRLSPEYLQAGQQPAARGTGAGNATKKRRRK